MIWSLLLIGLERFQAILFQHREDIACRCCDVAQACVDAAYQTNKDDAEGAYPKACCLGPVRFELWYRTLVLADKHRLNYQQIVVERDDGVDQRNEDENIDCHATRLRCAHKDEELAEEACKWWDATKREHSKHHHEGEPGIGLEQAVVVVGSNLACLALYHGNHAKGGEVAEDVNQDVVHHRSHSHSISGNHAKHNVACLRD